MPIRKIVKTSAVPIKIWTESIEDSALEQARILAEVMPLASHIVLLPDVHRGKGMPIGSVIPLDNAVSPYCVGVDIGCGMLAVKTSLHEIDMDTLGRIFRMIRERIPVGKRGRRKGANRVQWQGFENLPPLASLRKELKSARKQLGTLGGGNHFIEIQKGSDGHIWWMIHSGSRNIGFRIANHYHKLAVKEGTVPGGHENLAYLSCNSEPGIEYMEAMKFCLDFASQNRKVMSRDVQHAFATHLDFEILEEISIHHNFAVPYRLGNGQQVMLHRKGATEARTDTVGIIPGSQGSASFIVRGRGNPESYQSCSHGAGRKMSRTMARNTLDLEQCVQTMKRLGLQCDASRFSLDEAKEAYKDIYTVMADQSDLVEVMVELWPYKIPAIKG